ncbi:hypothetical protein ACQFX9_25815 [Aliinostoc sp. HNIBRCY26]|uniref:hypothetical protein n=1 Tax=Aliinostoc sp. HNIBRCY26 TaxID=3418997 RepID=UPI003D03D966
MAECKDLSAALKRLESAINKQNQCCQETKNKLKELENRIGALERGSRGGNSSAKQDRSLNDIYKRLQRLESYCQSIEGVFKNFATTIKQIKEIFLG